MKKILFILIGFISWSNVSVGQTNDGPNCTNNQSNCEFGNGISTNPDNPVNPNCPNMRNTFDWRVKRTDGYPENYIHYDNDGNQKQVINPFTGPHDAPYFGAISHDLESNFQPIDGWELISVDFGTYGNVNIDNDPNYTENQIVSWSRPRMPYFILYNKYTGTLRFFATLLDAETVHKAARIQVRIPFKTEKTLPPVEIKYHADLDATNLLSIEGEAIQPLDKETETTFVNHFVEFKNNENEFFYFDLPVAYDPCICNSKIQLDFRFSFISSADIDITGLHKGEIITKGTSNQPYAQIIFTRVLAAAVSGGVAFSTKGAVVNYKAFTDLIDIYAHHPNRTTEEQENALSLKKQLECGTKFLGVVQGNYIKLNNKDSIKRIEAAQKMVDANTTFLSSFFSGCKSDKNATAISGNLRMRGIYHTNTEYGDTRKSLALPGSNWENTELRKIPRNINSSYTPSYPAYNERLGVFALLETPTVKVTWRTAGDIKNFVVPPNRVGNINMPVSSQYKIIKFEQSSPLKYVFNPLINVDLENTTIYYRYSFANDIDNKMYLKINDETIPLQNITSNPNDHYKLATPYLPIDLYNSAPAFIIPFEENDFDDQKYFLTEVNGETIIEKMYNEKRSRLDSIFIQFKIVMNSTDNGSEGPISTIYYFTYPVGISSSTEVFNQNYNLPFPAQPTEDPNQTWENYASQVYARNLTIENLKRQDRDVFRPKPRINFGNKSFNQDIIFDKVEDMFYTGFVEISAKLSSNGLRVRIYSLLGFELLPGAEIDNRIELIVGYPYESNPIPPQTYQQVSDFCTSNKYKAKEFSASAIAEEKAYYEEQERARILAKMEEDRSFKFGLKPNPTSGMSTVFWDGDEMPNQLTLIDGTGQLLFETPLSGDGRSYDLDMSEYSHGVYFIIITAPSGKKGQQKLIKL